MLMLHELRLALRSLRRAPAFAITSCLTLVLAIGASVAIFTVVNGVLLRPLPYGEPDRLVGAWHDLPPLSLHKVPQTSGTYFAYRRLSRSIEDIGVYSESFVTVANSGGGEPAREEAGYVSSSIIPLLQVTPFLGRNFTELEDTPDGPKSVILGYALWRERYNGEPGIIGKHIDVNGVPREVVGVMPERFRFPTAAAKLWLPAALDPNGFSGGFNWSSIARLKPGITKEAAQRDFQSVLPRLPEVAPKFVPGMSSQTMLDQANPKVVLTSMHDDVVGEIARTLWMVAGAAGLLLLVASANVANLLLVRADARQRELAVREALGAGRARILGHFLAESLIIAGAAGAVGLFAAWAAVRALVAAGPAEIPRLAEVHVGAASLLFTIALVVLVAVVCSAIPALRLGRAQLANSLREVGRGGTAGRSRQRVRGALVAAQLALALVVLAGSGLLIRTFQKLNSVEPGFDASNVMTFWLSLPQARYAVDSSYTRFYAQLTERVSQLPGVRSAGVTSRLPLFEWGTNSSPLYAEGDPTSASKVPPLQLYTTIDDGYFRTMDIPLVAGRRFESFGLQSSREAIVSRRTALQFWNDSTGEAALGKRFRTLPGSPLYTVIGVAENVQDTSLAALPSQTVYFPQAPDADSSYGEARRMMALVVRTAGEPTAITGAVRRLALELDPTLPLFAVRPMSDVVQSSTAQLTFVILILGSAAAVTLLLGAIGLYGVIAYLVTLRGREMAVRMALGATPRSVASLLARQGLVLGAIGIGIGLALFAIVARFLRAFLYGVAPSDPVNLVVVSVVLLVTALLASWIPARRAARLDPAETLRSE